jgi:hypothetical protein
MRTVTTTRQPASTTNTGASIDYASSDAANYVKHATSNTISTCTAIAVT